jgi:cytochrome c peroxidase
VKADQDSLRIDWLPRLRAVAAFLFVLIAVAYTGDGLPVGFAAEPAAITRKPPRPERSPAERAAEARRLQEVYRGDPAAWPTPVVDSSVEWREIGLLPVVVHPESNPLSGAKAHLGKILFFDSRLSDSGKMSCASCHEPNLGWADGRAVSLPHGTVPARNTPTIRLTAFQKALFWDGRAASLEQQAEAALTNPAEMAADPERVTRMLNGSAGYRKMFAEAFPGRPITIAAVVEAMACFERTLVGGRSRFDAFLQGDEAGLSDAEILGLDLFRRDARCINCHHGPTFSDGLFHDLGLSFYGRSNEDPGRYGVTGDPRDNGRFRTPTLRDVTQTTPLMHTGMFELIGVLNMYNAGMVTLKRQDYQRDDPLFPVKSPLLKPLGLNRQDIADLAAFLGALQEPEPAARPPSLPRIEADDDASITAP